MSILENASKRELLDFLTRYPADFGRAVGFEKLGDIHNQWIQKMVLTDHDITIQGHRGSYKTTCLSIAIAEAMVFYPEENIIFMRKTGGDVVEVINQVSKILHSDPMRYVYKRIYGKELTFAGENATSITIGNYGTSRGAAQLLGIGTFGSITGKHADRVITDDIVNLEDRKSTAERERIKNIYQELQNIRNPGGVIINTGTPWHKEDAFMLMPNIERYDCYSTGMLSDEKIKELRKSMAPSLFAANYELRHIAAEDALFTTPPEFTNDVSLLRDGIAHIDAAYGGEDYTAFTCGKRIGDKIYMYGKMWHGHVDVVLDQIIQKSRELMCAPIMCESNADKKFLAKEIMAKGYTARSYTEKENKYVKISTLLRKWWSNIVWLEGTDRDYLDQIMDYTENAEHDDACDSAAVICRYYDRRSNEEYKSPFGGN